MDLKKVTTEQLQKELRRRKEEKEDSFPHLFLYSKVFNEFDTELMPVPTPKDLNILPMQLRCRYNSHRDLRLYSIRLTAEEGRRLNGVLNNKEADHDKTFQLIEKALVEVSI
jgi:hypothetical protein